MALAQGEGERVREAVALEEAPALGEGAARVGVGCRRVALGVREAEGQALALRHVDAVARCEVEGAGLGSVDAVARCEVEGARLELAEGVEAGDVEGLGDALGSTEGSTATPSKARWGAGNAA